MNVIIVQSWLNTIGDIANQFVMKEKNQDFVSLLAGVVKGSFPFVEADLARVGDTGKAFLPAQIPTAVISGIFDLTESDAKELGFQPVRQK